MDLDAFKARVDVLDAIKLVCLLAPLQKWKIVENQVIQGDFIGKPNKEFIGEFIQGEI